MVIYMKRVEFNDERCKSCELCITVCPKKIISISDDKINSKGYRPAQVKDMEQCIGCAFCASMCPDAAITITDEEN